MKKTALIILGVMLAGCQAPPAQVNQTSQGELLERPEFRTDNPVGAAETPALEAAAQASDRVALSDRIDAPPASLPAEDRESVAAQGGVTAASEIQRAGGDEVGSQAGQATGKPAAPVKQTTQAVQVAQAVEAPKATAQEAPRISQRARNLDSRMDKVVKLINSSSGARQVLGSDNPEAHAFHAEAKALYAQALNAPDKEHAAELLNEAVKAMYSAIRAASPPSVLAEKKKRDYQRLRRSVDTFLEQDRRISEEKQNGKAGDELRQQVNVLIAEADKKHADGEYDEAQLLLRESFEMLRNHIEGMRSGDTLVRSLNFANKEEEYDYELERFKSQRLLVDVLLEDKRKSSPYVAQQVDKYVKIAEENRQKAESQAADGNFEDAINDLEEGRKYIVRALRTGGIYVPG